MWAWSFAWSLLGVSFRFLGSSLGTHVTFIPFEQKSAPVGRVAISIELRNTSSNNSGNISLEYDLSHFCIA